MAPSGPWVLSTQIGWCNEVLTSPVRNLARGRKGLEPEPSQHSTAFSRCEKSVLCTTSNHGSFSRSLHLSPKVQGIGGFFLKGRKSGLCFCKGEACQRRKQTCQRDADCLTQLCVLFFSSFRGKQASTASLPWLQSASILLDALMLEYKSEPRKVSNRLTPASSRD